MWVHARGRALSVARTAWQARPQWLPATCLLDRRQTYGALAESPAVPQPAGRVNRPAVPPVGDWTRTVSPEWGWRGLCNKSAGDSAGDGDKSKEPEKSEDKKAEKTEESASSSDETELKESLLKEALSFVNTHGWTLQALQAAAVELKLSPAVAAGLYKDGAIELVTYFVKKINKDTIDAVTKENAEEGDGESSSADADKAVPDHNEEIKRRLLQISKARLGLMIPYLPRWPQAIGVLLSNMSRPQALELGLLTSSMMLTYGFEGKLVEDSFTQKFGDRSIVENFMKLDVEQSEALTKVAVFGAAYASAEVYMMTDYSAGNKDTWSFLERQVDELFRWDRKASKVHINLRSTLNTVKSTLERLPDPWQILRQFGTPR